MPVLAHDTDNFHVVRRAVFWRIGVANVLTDRIFVREKFVCHFFVNDHHAPSILGFGFALREIAAS